MRALLKMKHIKPKIPTRNNTYDLKKKRIFISYNVIFTRLIDDKAFSRGFTHMLTALKPHLSGSLPNKIYYIINLTW